MGGETPTGAGSSPLSRGAPSVYIDLDFPARIIPALAGSTAGLSALYRSQSDHPRSRGEHFVKTLLAQPESGSSPLSRGALSFL